MSYEPITVKLCISAKAFHILKSDESCFARACFKASNNRISETMVNTIIKNIDIPMNSNDSKDTQTMKKTTRSNSTANSTKELRKD